MMKALEILKNGVETLEKSAALSNNESFKVAILSELDAYNEAIKELKELDNRSCDGCRHYVQINKSDSFVCSLWLDCSRKYKPKDRFEKKDKK